LTYAHGYKRKNKIMGIFRLSKAELGDI